MIVAFFDCRINNNYLTELNYIILYYN